MTERTALLYAGALIASVLAFKFGYPMVGLGMIIGMIATFRIGRWIFLGLFLGVMSGGSGSRRSDYDGDYDRDYDCDCGGDGDGDYDRDC